MKTFCRIQRHEDKPIEWVCTNPSCPHSRLFCSKCLKQFHKDCLEFSLEIDDINKRTFSDNIEWIKDTTISEAILAVEKNKLQGSKVDLAATFGKLIEEEFTKVIEFFMMKIQETKAKVFENISKLSMEGVVVTEEFPTKLKSLYNFDSFLGILDPIKQDGADIVIINKQLDEFFHHINSQVDQQKELHEMARKIISIKKKYLEIDHGLFDKFLRSMQFDLFEGYPARLASTWSWSAAKKSSKITLSDDNTVAKKEDGAGGYTAVLGDTEFDSGKWNWEIEVASGRNDKKWVYFGVIEPSLVHTSENLPYNSGIGLDTYGSAYGMSRIVDISGYDNKKYLCELDLNEGTFRISCGGKEVSKEFTNLKGKKLVPFVTLYEAGNRARLKTLD